ncbi:MAG: hypothetical protein QM682_17765 [Paracoccus sp. (in: a-proteobacteria)]|uniref:hypothetical protein n=1 Tax=Paracoccus sp. TaxID=267 RepID=UPI0039E4939F
MKFDEIRKARQALAQLDPERALELLETLRSRGRPAPAEVEILARKLVELRDAAAATAEGMAQARAQLKELLAQTSRLDTYDQAGHRHSRDLNPPLVRKF